MPMLNTGKARHDSASTQRPAGEIVTPPFDDAAQGQIRHALASGRVMTYPTETSYALGGNALSHALVESIYRLKGRERGKPLLLLVDGSEDLERWVCDIPAEARKLMSALWPGPLTMVFHASRDLPAHLPDTRGTIAVRWSPHPLVAELLKLGRVPLIGTSANSSGTPASHSAESVLRAFPADLLLAVEGGATAGGVASTVLDTTTRPFSIAREGAIPADVLSRTLGERLSVGTPQ